MQENWNISLSTPAPPFEYKASLFCSWWNVLCNRIRQPNGKSDNVQYLLCNFVRVSLRWMGVTLETHDHTHAVTRMQHKWRCLFGVFLTIFSCVFRYYFHWKLMCVHNLRYCSSQYGNGCKNKRSTRAISVSNKLWKELSGKETRRVCSYSIGFCIYWILELCKFCFWLTETVIEMGRREHYRIMRGKRTDTRTYIVDLCHKRWKIFKSTLIVSISERLRWILVVLFTFYHGFFSHNRGFVSKRDKLLKMWTGHMRSREVDEAE